MSDNELKLLALHFQTGPDGCWYVVATVVSPAGTPVTKLVYEAPPTLRPVFVPEYGGQLTWEPKVKKNLPP